MNDDMASIFREELRDLLESLERGLMDLKSRPEDAGLVNQVFRDLHTVKGSGAMFGFSDLAAFIHAFETAFDRVRSGKVPVTPDLIRLGLSARDEIPGLVDGTPDPEGRRDGILSALQVLTSGEVAAPPPATAAPAATEAAAPSAPSRLTFRLTGAALALGSRPELLLNELRELGAQNISADLTRLPELAGLDVDACHVGWHMDLPPPCRADRSRMSSCLRMRNGRSRPPHPSLPHQGCLPMMMRKTPPRLWLPRPRGCLCGPCGRGGVPVVRRDAPRQLPPPRQRLPPLSGCRRNVWMH
ncbi:Hpt domain-containing protein [Gemmobacter lanyuensis]